MDDAMMKNSLSIYEKQAHCVGIALASYIGDGKEKKKDSCCYCYLVVINHQLDSFIQTASNLGAGYIPKVHLQGSCL